MFSAPVLYGFSFVSTSVMSSFSKDLSADLPQEISSFAWVNPTEDSAIDSLDGFIVTNLFTTALLGSLIIGFVSSGKILEGLRYFFPSSVVSILMYVLSKSVLFSFFENMMM